MKLLYEHLLDLEGEIRDAKTEERKTLNLLVEAQMKVNASQSLKELYGIDALHFVNHRDYYKAQYDKAANIVAALESTMNHLDKLQSDRGI